MTGIQLFVKINATNLDYGDPVDNVPPADVAFEADPVSALTVTAPGGVAAFKLTCGAVPDGIKLGVWASKPVSQGISVCSALTLLGVAPAPVAGVIDITALYVAKYGAPPASTKVFVQVNQETLGWEDNPVKFSGIIPAGG